MRNSNVVQSWLAGNPAKSGSLSTDGHSLFSYNLKIAEGCRIYNYTSSGKYRSQTTSCHVGLARRIASEDAYLCKPPYEG